MLSTLGDPYDIAAAKLAGAPLVVAVDADVLNLTDGAIMSRRGPCVAKL